MANELYQFPNASYDLNSIVTTTVSWEPLMFPLMLLGIWIIGFLATKQYTSSRAWTFSSFICFILAIPISAMGWLSSNYIYLLLFMTAVGVVWMRIGDSQW